MFSNILYALTHSTLADFFDILLMTVIIYSTIMLIKDSKAYQMAMGLALIGLFFLITKWARMVVSHELISNFSNYLIIGVIILFQGEIRRFLTSLGSRSFRSQYFIRTVAEQWKDLFIAVDYMSRTKTGALIAIEKKITLKSYIESGTLLNADLTKDLLGSIFFPHSPLHDGAVIIKDNKILAAGCLLPLPAAHKMGPEFQTRTRHLAAIGLSQETDAAVIVVSEETGMISLAIGGKLNKNIKTEELKTILFEHMK